MICLTCAYWLPFSPNKAMGICDNSESVNSDTITLSDDKCEKYQKSKLEGIEDGLE